MELKSKQTAVWICNALNYSDIFLVYSWMTDNHDHQDEHRLIAERRAKLSELRQLGNAYPNDFRPNVLAKQLQVRFADQDKAELEKLDETFALAGRMLAKRVMGKAAFVQLQDRSGVIQLFLQRDAIGAEVYQAFKHWDVGDIVAVVGTIFRTNTGELSIKANQLRLLTKSLRPLPEKFHGFN